MHLRVSFVLFALCALQRVTADDCPADRTQPDHDEARLHKDLLCAYSTDYRPVKDHRNTITVKVRLALKYMSFDSLEETFTTHSWVAMTWKDEMLTWNPNNYGYINETQIESHLIWTPQMALFNADVSMYPSEYFYTNCLLAFNGTVTCVPHLAHSGICRTTLKRWPYDSQNCTLYFGSWMHSGEQVNFTFYRTEPVVLREYQNGPGWQLLNVANTRYDNKYGNNTYPMLKYTFMLRRLAAGPAAIVVVPSVVIVILTLASLLLDVNDNTRLTLVCFSLFAHFMFVSEIGYDIPKHSSDTPIILLFIRDSMIITLSGILITLVLMSLRKRVIPAPTWIVSINRLISSGPGKYVVFTDFEQNDTADRKVLTDDSNLNVNNERPRDPSDWIQFANLLNSIVFIVVLLIYVLLICTYIP